MPNLLKRGRKLVKVGRKLALATAACIARCCRRCPGPVLRRKCDRYCPDTTTAYGFWRIDLDALIAPGGITWRQWIADNDAALTPCRLIQFGTDPENCYVLDRNCSRCFWSGCNYNLDIPSLPVVPPELINPRLATCDDCILCVECCASMVWRDCSGMDRCYECGSNYRLTTSMELRSTYQTWGRTSLGVVYLSYDETIDKSITQETEVLCVDTDPGTGRCNTSTMRDTYTGQWNTHARFTTSIPGNQGQPPTLTYHDLDATDSNPPAVTPNGCGQILRHWQLIETPYIGGLPTLSTLTTPAQLSSYPVRGSSGTAQSIMRTQCSGTIYQPTFFPASTTLSTETRWTWAVTFNGSSGLVTYTYDRKTYAWPSGQQPYLASHNVATMTRNFQFSRIASCAPDAPLGCNDPLRRKQGDPSGIGNGNPDLPIGGLQASNPLYNPPQSTGDMI